jgi:membrane protein YdbS with pleckstrin-like domain
VKPRADGAENYGGTVSAIELSEGHWNRVSPKYVVVDVVGLLIFGVLATAVASLWLIFSGQPLAWVPPIAIGVLFLISVILTPRRVRSIGYQLREDDLLFRRGVMFRRVVAVPYGRMQLVDINRGPIDRALGLSELKFVTAAASSGVVIPGLPEADADTLRDELVKLAETRRAGL